MRIVLLPAGDENTASSRIRVYTLWRALNSLGNSATLGDSQDADVLFIQKRVTWETLKVAREAKARGCLILYDVDDLGEDVRWAASERCFYEMIRLADVITTDTQGHGDQLRRRVGVKRIEVIPDAIDYYPSGPVRPPMGEGRPLRILWFGNIENITSFEQYTSTLITVQDVQLVVVTNGPAVPLYSAKYPDITFVPWSRKSFVSTLQSCDLSCLMHDGPLIDQAKSNNKMIASITWGLPAVVSRTPEYERTAREAGIQEAVFSSELELRVAIERLRPREARLAYLDTAQPAIWSRYAPNTVARKFIETASKYSSAKITALVPLREKSFTSKGCELAGRVKSRISFEVWRFRFGEDRIGLIKSIACEAMRRAYRAVLHHRSATLVTLTQDSSASMQRDRLRDEAVIADQTYRRRTSKSLRTTEVLPLTAHPWVDEVHRILRTHQPRSILQVDCGSGCLLETLADEFAVEGCDASQDMLKSCSPTLKVFPLDIALDNPSFRRNHAGQWDVLFTTDVMRYFIDVPVQLANAMNNMLMLASKKIIVWECREVCERMEQFSSSSKYEFHPIERGNKQWD